MKKIILKKKVVPIETQPIKATFIPAIEMEPGVEYLNPSCTAILKLKQVKENNEPAFKGIRSLLCIPVELEAMHMRGGEAYTCSYTGLHPVLVAPPDEIERIKKAAEKYNSEVAKYRPSAPVKTKVVVNEETGERETVVVKRQARGDIDPRTGYGKGTQGHLVGTIMLDNKCSPTTRAVCVAKIQEMLAKDFGFNDEKKCKALAQSWYSTLWTRKASLYQKKW